MNKMQVILDPHAGVCPGVLRAIRLAEQALATGTRLVAVGPLIHNPLEIERLIKLGLETVAQEIFENSDAWISDLKGATLLIRTHGISRHLRMRFENAQFQLLDATCPRVLRSQRLIEDYQARGYQVIIVGHRRHPEVLGLLGAATGKAIVIEKLNEAILVSGHRPTLVIAQTTTNVQNFEEISRWFQAQQSDVVVENTICRAVTLRHERLREFAHQVEVVLMAGGRSSSNTRELVEISQTINPRTYLIEQTGDIESHWLTGIMHVGVTGSASTPRWQLEKIRQYLDLNDFVPNPIKI